ncbi:PhoX family phosphatase [Bradyrhizobium sp. LHD-71]|uniref:PhoX family protein n=1 Tax=Bradyrhizobium sp. LHD-71 TaxID=3072141 RepID=UPI00280EA9FE|nr:PhoX family phosphatase [Bradyrhizobium sp. LHD-71]MDQ8726097.1 PhoX family phosphatase [Bradyrhizobium sp. LHD-71]
MSNDRDVTNSENHTRSQLAESSQDVGVNRSANATIGDIIAARFSRRDFAKGALGVAAIAATTGSLAFDTANAQAGAPAAASRFGFNEVEAKVEPNHAVADGHDADILIRWGDPVLPGAPAFDPHAQTSESQSKQFGYNNDFLGYFPMPGAANPSAHGLLVANHEYTNEELMFPGVGRQDVRSVAFAKMTPELAAVEMAAHGGSVIEIRREGGKWSVVPNSKYARRIDATTPMEITGPAAGHPRLKTKDDPTGKRVLGMVNNCAGGVTPWGTWLTCEENTNFYFFGALDEQHAEAKNHKRYGIPGNVQAWGKYHDRFALAKEPTEPNRFGWIVEIDPFDPSSTPKKRTALGRLKHEGAAGTINKDGRYIVYTGDDERFDYVYRFVTNARVDRDNPKANADILDNGTLSVARYNADGTLTWLPIVFGEGPLSPDNGFHNQADVLIETRRAADLLGATKMDRPEDIETSPVTNKVYVALTNNNRRKAEQIDAANPRTDNRFGHIIEMVPPDGDHAAQTYRWEILVRCGDPAIADVGATFSSETTRNGWFGMPDNLAIDHQGRLWVATDGNSGASTGRADGVWGVETEGAARGTSRHFYRAPAGAELCGPCFTPDGETLFVSIQHPGEADDDNGPAATFENPSTRWPDFKPDMPPRPSIVAITRKSGGKIGV